MRIWVATLETRHFFFDAYGTTEGDAIEVLRWGWRWHRVRTDATLTWDDVKDDVITREVLVGAAYRDGNEITTEPGKCAPEGVDTHVGFKNAITRRLL